MDFGLGWDVGWFKWLRILHVYQTLEADATETTRSVINCFSASIGVAFMICCSDLGKKKFSFLSDQFR
jgi:hypothetical protein